jgi:signal transduction histidine kinase
MIEFDLKDIGQEAYLQTSLIPEFDSTGKVISILCVARDVYELRNLEEEISRLDRLNVIGEVAASIGHEVRNPMTVVRGFLQQLGLNQDLDHYKNYFELMIEELDRANSIITEFLSLAKNKFIEMRKIHLNEVITSILPLLQAEAINNAQSIECDLINVPEINVDPNEVRQMLINFVRNAIEASKPGRTIWIKTHVEHNEVVLKVTDQGCGIAPEIRRRIGLPFTTSKENGIGLGLAVCFSIAHRHNAKIDFTTSKKGTTFFIRFPA